MDRDRPPADDARPGAVTIRPVREDDLPVLFEHQRDPEANAMAAFPARDREAFMHHWKKILSDETLLAQAIELEGRLVGNVGSFEFEGHREVGYWIDRAFWGRGVATRALAAFLRVETRRPLFAGVVPHNIGSIRVLEKNGFEPTGETSDDGHTIFRLS
jgi:RimJ/RimL family protein N-acetyltransferase